MSTFKFELLKVVKNKFHYIGILFLLILFLYPLYFYPDNERIQENNINLLQSNIDMARNSLTDKSDDPGAKEMYEGIEKNVKLMQELLLAYRTYDNRSIVESHLAIDRDDLENTLNGSLIGQSEIDIKRNIEVNEYLLEHDLQRVEPFAIKVPAVNYLYSITSNTYSFKTLLLILGLVLGYLYTNEKRKNNINLLNTLPINLYKVSLQKIVGISIFVIMTFLMPLIIVFITVTVIHGVGDFNYPMVYTVDNEVVIVNTLLVYLLKYLTLTLLSIILISLICYLLSLFTGNIMIVVMMLIVLVFIADPKSLNIDILKEYAHYSPVTYFNVQDVLLGQSEFNPLPNLFVTFKNGILTLSLSILAVSMSIITVIFFKKKL